MFQIGTVLGLTLTMVLAFQNCGDTNEMKSANSSGLTIDSYPNEKQEKILRDLINEDLSCDQDSQCVLVGVGHKACGGPRDLAVASTKSSNYQHIQDLAEEVKETEYHYLYINQLAGTCEAPYREQPTCVQNICQ